MRPPTYSESLLQPLTTDALVEQRVSALVGRACRRQLWFLFLDEHQVQLPLIIPVGDPPTRPDASVRNLAEGISIAMESAAAASVIVVIERFADQAVTPADTEWARTIDEEFREKGLRVRGFLLSHRRGVRWLAPDDYRFPVRGSDR
ncbi:hypothetical protein [Lacisediminihabitans sp.]|jgi:hypothetical protein|uniref:hypothetical protein n=1 Tax=Lacisediminihabitans sp. TaxID=2787631 RepID=UPI002F93BD6E